MLTVNELFSGIGAQVAALKRLGIDHKVIGISEIDTAAIQSYERINGCVRNYGDISKIEKLDYADLWTYSFPCQDLSVAGKKNGISEGTRSGLLLEVERLLEAAVKEGTQPKYLLLENVKNLVGKKFKPDFDRWLNKLSELGYDNYWKVLNAKDFGIPQNRERVFVVSIRKGLNQTYVFPEPVPLTLKLKDLLETEVDERYYLPQEKVEKLALNCGGSLDGKHTWDVVIAASRGRNLENPSSREAGLPTEQRMEINSSGVSNTLTTVQKDNLVMCVPINTCSDGSCQALTAHMHKESANDCTKFERHSPATGVLEIKANTKKGYEIAEEGDPINLEQPNSTARRGRIGKGKAQTLTTSCNQGVVEIGVGHNPISKKFEFDGFHDQPAPTLLATDYKAPKCYSDGIRIRKLTPKECWRLMGFTDEEFDKAKGKFLRIENRPVFKVGSDGLNHKVGTTPTEIYEQSNTQLYKQAGNSIVVDVLIAIFKNLNLE